MHDASTCSRVRMKCSGGIGDTALLPATQTIPLVRSPSLFGTYTAHDTGELLAFVASYMRSVMSHR
jgi:hypothetical protein